jgi:pyruvate/2-oxoglutarate dehydrogenase complex dihydrolipoamide dehydrogenase (E3) component
MAELLKPDICVIGAGSGGLSVAAAAKAFGASVALIEKGKMGGDCLNYGCVPSKALIAAGKRVANIRAAAAFGVVTERPKIKFLNVQRHVENVIATIAPNDSKERFIALGVRVVQGAARFKDAATLLVDDEDVEVRARRFVIATGSTPAIPPIKGLASVPYLTNETVFDLTSCPKHLIVIGAGSIGLELAQAFRRLGAAITVLEAASPLSSDDAECAEIVLDRLAREGLTLYTGVEVRRVSRVRGKIQVIIANGAGEEKIEGTHLLLATGRRPNIDDLALEAAGIKHGDNGITVDKRLRTTNRRVYAIGDVVGGPLFTHAANYHAGVVVRSALFRLPTKVNYNLMSWVTYTDPELAQTGLTEAAARERGRSIRILRWPYHENDRAQAERETKGYIKVITNKRGRILGATIVGAGAGEMIATWALAVAQHLNVRAFVGTMIPYPTFAEIGKRAGLSYFTARLTSPMLRRIIRVLRRFG